MNVADDADAGVSRIAAAIGERGRARILYCLMDGRARTSTELAAVAEVSPSTASAHVNRLKAERLVKVVVQGKHRYHTLDGPRVARALEALSVLAGGARAAFVPSTPSELRAARTCYDHIAGSLGVLFLDRMKALKWLAEGRASGYDLTPLGESGCDALGIDVAAIRTRRRRFAYACLDWSERRPHLAGALGAALLRMVLARHWVTPDPDGRGLEVTARGRREMLVRLGLRVS